MTLIFNIVVIYTSFKQINCRIIFDSFNIFKRIINSSLFSLITFGEMAIQTLIVLFEKSIFNVTNNSLTGFQWGICFEFSVITFIVSIFEKIFHIDQIINSQLSTENHPNKKNDEDDSRGFNFTIESSEKLVNEKIKVKKKKKF